MSDHACVVTADTDFGWDGAVQRLRRGQVIDVAPGSALEQAIGSERLQPLCGPPPVSPSAVPEVPAVPSGKTPGARKAPAASARGRGRAAAQQDDAGAAGDSLGTDAP